jgi:hypothetical protein
MRIRRRMMILEVRRLRMSVENKMAIDVEKEMK